MHTRGVVSGNAAYFLLASNLAKFYNLFCFFSSDMRLSIVKRCYLCDVPYLSLEGDCESSKFPGFRGRVSREGSHDVCHVCDYVW